MNKKPRRPVRVNAKEAAKQEFRTCEYPGCRNVVSTKNKPQKSRIFCVLHVRAMESK